MKYLAALMIWIGLMTSSQAFADMTAKFGLRVQVPFTECQQAHAATRKIVIPHAEFPSTHYVLVSNVIYEMRLGSPFSQAAGIIELNCYKSRLLK